jgi:hypothetical protein
LKEALVFDVEDDVVPDNTVAGDRLSVRVKSDDSGLTVVLDPMVSGTVVCAFVVRVLSLLVLLEDPVAVPEGYGFRVDLWTELADAPDSIVWVR